MGSVLWNWRCVLAILCITTAAVLVEAQCPAQLPYTVCPTATAAAQLLTGNSPYLPISNAVFAGACAGATGQLAIIPSFQAGCHYLSNLMPQGEQQQAQPVVCGTHHQPHHQAAGRPADCAVCIHRPINLIKPAVLRPLPLHAGALVISTGSASAGASTSNTGTVSTNHKTNNGDKDMQDINSKIYSQPLNDLALLTFDIVPTASGAIYFRCVCVVKV